MLAFQAGARVMHGREGKAVFGESLAPDVSDDYTMGSSLMFTARDMGRPVPFTAPPWAYHYTDADIPGHQDHHNGPVVEATSGYWWLELGGDQRDSLKDGEEIRDELLKTRTAFGIISKIRIRAAKIWRWTGWAFCPESGKAAGSRAIMFCGRTI